MVVVLHDIEGMPYEEIAQVDRVPAGYSEVSAVQRARPTATAASFLYADLRDRRHVGENTMKCDVSKELISECVDGCVDPKLMDQLQTHIAGCADCARWEEEIRTVSGMLRGLPIRRHVGGF